MPGGTGTIAGAAIGLVIAFSLKTTWGRRFTSKVEAGAKWTFEKGKDLGKGLFKKYGMGVISIEATIQTNDYCLFPAHHICANCFAYT